MKTKPIKKIETIYANIKHRYSNSKNNQKERLLLKTELIYELGDQFEVKCNEENNPPDIIDLNCIVVGITWNNQKGGYNYCKLVFGNEANISIVQEMLLKGFHQTQTWKPINK